MKKLLLFFITMIIISCDENEKKYAYVEVDDDRSEEIENLFDAVEDENIDFLKTLFSKDLVFISANNEQMNKDQFIEGVEEIFDMFDDVEFDDNTQSTDGDGTAIETTYYSNGAIWTEIWNNFSGKGKYTGNEISFPFYIAYLWDEDKIIREMQYFDPKYFNEEAEAKSKLSQ